MRDWFQHTPRTMLDWLVLVAAGAAVWLAVGALPQLLQGAGALAGLLAPFALGLVLAYVLDIPTRFFAQRLFCGRRLPAIAVSYLLFFGVITALGWLVAPQLMQSIRRFLAELDTYTATVSAFLARLQTQFGLDTANAAALLSSLGGDLQSALGALLGNAGRLVGAAADAAAGAMDGFIALAVSVYLLAGKESLLRGARLTLRALLPPRAAASVTAVCALANRTFAGYIGGQLADALLVGAETFLLMRLLRLDYAPLIAVLVGATNVIPVLGPFLGAVPGAVLLLLESPFEALEFVLVVLVVQQVDGSFIAPRILGGATGLSGLGVLFAILVGGRLFGIAGMLVAVPTLAVLAALARQGVGAGLSARGLDPETGEEKTC